VSGVAEALTCERAKGYTCLSGWEAEGLADALVAALTEQPKEDEK